MKNHPRGKTSGQTLMSQGEPMVWLTGGMFAIACTMIFALLSFILYQGLATHWQRPYFIYALNDSAIIGGELQNVQPLTINRESSQVPDDISQDKALAMAETNRPIVSKQLYLRTGNYDVGNKHFAYVSEAALSSPEGYKPPDVWLLERREWGVMYGFPSKLISIYRPEFDDRFNLLHSTSNQLDQFMPATSPQDNANVLSMDSLKPKMQAYLEQLESELTSNKNQSNLNTTDAKQLESATRQAMTIGSKVAAEMESAKRELGRLDKVLSDCRLNIRKAELYDKTDLQSLADQAIELATAQANISAQSAETLRGIDKWQAILKDDVSLKQLATLRAECIRQRDEQLQGVVDALQEIEKSAKSFPRYSEQAILLAIEKTRKATTSQFETNVQLSRLEEIGKSLTLVLQLPIVESVGQIHAKASDIANPSPEFSERFAQLVGIESTTAGPLKDAALSETHTLLKREIEGEGINRYLSVFSASDQQATIYKFQRKEVLVSDIVRFTLPNQLSWLGKAQLYWNRWMEFLFGQPREAGIEGGFFPALWGTIVMTVIMSMAVMPFGVIAALYMREYAKSGWVLSLIRISINNLAGVPSIVYGVFGLAFFCYTIGGYIDGGPIKAGFAPWPSGTWFVALAVTVFAGTIAFFLAAMGSGSPALMSKTRRRIANFSGLFWLLSLVCVIALFAKSPFFHGFYEATLPNPTFGKGCLLWASCTLALLTLPVVIVATEEALSAVPNSLREGSYACGAGKWQTLQRIVLPYARPGIITGFILAMARGAGEVAPMMLVGAIPLATELPLDLDFPFFHGSRSFMHLGFQIYSLGFQSQNSEAAKPMVFTATLLLLTIVTLLNVTAIWLRARLRKRFQGSQF